MTSQYPSEQNLAVPEETQRRRQLGVAGAAGAAHPGSQRDHHGPFGEPRPANHDHTCGRGFASASRRDRHHRVGCVLYGADHAGAAGPTDRVGVAADRRVDADHHPGNPARWCRQHRAGVSCHPHLRRGLVDRRRRQSEPGRHGDGAGGQPGLDGNARSLHGVRAGVAPGDLPVPADGATARHCGHLDRPFLDRGLVDLAPGRRPATRARAKPGAGAGAAGVEHNARSARHRCKRPNWRCGRRGRRRSTRSARP